MTLEWVNAEESAEAHEEYNDGHMAQICWEHPDIEGLVEVYCLDCDWSCWCNP